MLRIGQNCRRDRFPRTGSITLMPDQMRTGQIVKKVLTCLIPAVTLLTLSAGGIVAADKKAALKIGLMLEVMSSGQCIDNAGSRKSGAALQGWKCNPRNLNQRFAVTRDRNMERPVTIRNKLSTLCLDVQRQSRKARARIVQNKCSKAKSQNWKFSKSGKKDWFLIQTGHSGLCLSLSNKGKRESFLIQTKCNKRDPNQIFKLRS